MTAALNVNCNLCGADDYTVMFEKGVAQVAQIVKCRKCELMYANPRGQVVDADNYQAHEAENLLDGLEDDPMHRYRWRWDKESLQVRDFDNTWETLKRLYPQKGHVVEVGSGLGFLLRRFVDDGWTATGVDPWVELPSFTKRYHGIESKPLTLEQAKLPDESADVVILLHVIEHVPDPVETMREIYRVLKPGGHMVLETPRYDTFMFRMMGKRERSLRMSGHIYFFTDDSLRETYEKVGFKGVETRHVGRSLTAERFIWNAANIAKNPEFTRKMTGLARKTGLANIKFRLNLKDMVRIVVQKPAG